MSNIHKEVLDILNKSINEYALKFTKKSQVDALKILGIGGTYDALKFKYSFQVKALELLGKDRIEDALKFIDDGQVSALDFFSTNRVDYTLKYFGINKIDYALRFDAFYQVQILEMLFGNRINNDYYPVIDKGMIEDALKFTNYNQVTCFFDTVKNNNAIISGEDIDKCLHIVDNATEAFYA